MSDTSFDRVRLEYLLGLTGNGAITHFSRKEVHSCLSEIDRLTAENSELRQDISFRREDEALTRQQHEREQAGLHQHIDDLKRENEQIKAERDEFRRRLPAHAQDLKLESK